MGKGYKKVKLNEDVVNEYLIKKQRSRIQEIESAKKKAMRDKITKAVMSFKEINIAKNKEDILKIKKMREWIIKLGKKKDIPGKEPQIIEYGEITPVERNPY